MNAQQFQSWWEDYCTRFPDTLSWINNSETPAATLRIWKSIFDQKHIDLDDAKEVARMMLRGELDRVPAFEREMTATVVAREASKLAYDRKQAKLTPTQRHMEERYDVDDPTIRMGGIYKQICAALAEGRSTDEVIDKVFGNQRKDAF